MHGIYLVCLFNVLPSGTLPQSHVDFHDPDIFEDYRPVIKDPSIEFFLKCSYD